MPSGGRLSIYSRARRTVTGCLQNVAGKPPPTFAKLALASTFLCGFLGLVVSVGLSVGGCAYSLGGPARSLPGGHTQIHIPIFKNRTQEVGIEVGFTNALIQEFERSRSGRVVPPQYAEAVVEGEIRRLTYTPGGIQGGENFPKGSVMASQYTIIIEVDVTLRKKSDNTQLWTGSFSKEQIYVAPLVLQAGINTVNPLYNLSARRQNIDNMASDLMSEAHDRMSESF